MASSALRGHGDRKLTAVQLRFKHLSWLFVAVGLILALPEVGSAQSIEILSKEDAKQLFALDQFEWVQNVMLASTAGAARALRMGGTNVGMVTDHPGIGHMIVKPDYGDNPDKPDFIQVTVAYLPQFASVFDKQRRRELLENTKKQMAPEYNVILNFEVVQGRPTFFFLILEAAPNR